MTTKQISLSGPRYQNWHAGGEPPVVLNPSADLHALIAWCWGEAVLANQLAINAQLCAVTVLADGQPVGFFVLDNGALCLNHQRQPGAVLLRSLSINPAYQGQGIAKAAVAAHRLDAVVRQHDPDSQRLILGVNRCNTVARDLYLAAGFYDTGVYINGVAGAQHIFQRKFA